MLRGGAAFLLALLLVLPASAAGAIDRLIDWGAETFSLQPASGVMELETADENGFRSLREALEYYGVEDPAIPTWIPGRYAIEEIVALKSDDSAIISGKYTADNQELFVRISIPFEEAFTFEKNVTDEYAQYIAKNGITFTLFRNLEMGRAVWNINGYVYNAAGDITEEELKQMLDSIQVKR